MEKCSKTLSTILVVEDFKPIRAVITSLLDGNSELRVVGKACDGVEAVAKAQELRPDVVLMDFGETSAEVLKEALSLGAWGYIVKQQMGNDLLKGLTSILQGKKFVGGCFDGNWLATPTASKPTPLD